MKNLLIISLLGLALNAAGQNMDYPDFIPMPLPQWTAPVGTITNENYLIGFDTNSETEFIADSNEYDDYTKVSQTDHYVPDGLGEYKEVIGQKNFSNITLVSNTTIYPASGNVKLYIKFPNMPPNTVYVGSGILVSKNVVLTAGHMIHDKDRGGWANSVEVIPGYNSGNKPFGEAFDITLYSWTPWIENKNYDWDMGIILLNKNIGKQTGWFGHGTYHDAFFTSNTFHNYSYPSESPYDGQNMYYRYGDFDEVTQHILYFNNTSYGGQSGSGFYYKDVNGNRCTYAVLSHSLSYQRTGCTRITSPKFNRINYVIEIGAPMIVREKIDDKHINFSLFPNPSIDKINIEFPDNHTTLTIAIFDLLGSNVKQIIAEADDNILNVPIDNLKPGFYIISVNDGKLNSSQTFVKSSNR